MYLNYYCILALDFCIDFKMNSVCINIRCLQQTISDLCSSQSFRGTYIIGMHVTRATEFRLGSDFRAETII